jgi:hypothetical protein
MMNQRNLIIGAVVLIGGYYIYKMYYTKPKTTTTTKPKLPPTEPIRDKGEPITPTPTSESSFDSFVDDGL